MFRNCSIFLKLLIITNFVVFLLLSNNYFAIKNSNTSINYQEDVKQIQTFLNRPHIFIGGTMSSGSSLLRSILDVHPSVKCGPETKFIQLLLEFLRNLYQTGRKHFKFMEAAGISNQTLDESVGLAIYNLMLKNVQSDVDRLCNKEPTNCEYIGYFKRVFPNSKFILIIRDGREVAYSLIKRTNSKFSTYKFNKHLTYWNNQLNKSYFQCLNIGPNYCLIIRYEKLVTSPMQEIEKIVNFLQLTWSDKMLKHQKYIDTEIKMSKTEWSREGMLKEINAGSLKNWKGNIPGYNHSYIMKTYNMFRVLNYTD